MADRFAFRRYSLKTNFSMLASFYYYDQDPSGFCFLANKGFCYLNLTGITKFKYEKKNEKSSGHISKMTPSYKWPIDLLATRTNHDILLNLINYLLIHRFKNYF